MRSRISFFFLLFVFTVSVVAQTKKPSPPPSTTAPVAPPKSGGPAGAPPVQPAKSAEKPPLTPLVPGPKDYKIPDTLSATFKTSDGTTLHYLEKGAGHPLVFIPGWTMTADIFEPQLMGLAGRFRVLALDPRSQGDSEKVADGNTLERRALDIKEFLEATTAQDAIVVGWSNAVPELLTLADKYGTGRIRGIVLVDGVVGFDDMAQLTAGIGGFLKMMQEDRPHFADTFVRIMYRHTWPETYYARIREDSLKMPTNTAVVVMYNTVQNLDRRAMLAKLDKPLLYICTEPLIKQSEAIKAKLPSARVEMFKDAGHALFVDDAQRFNDLITEFATSVAAGPTAAKAAPAAKPAEKTPSKPQEQKK